MTQPNTLVRHKTKGLCAGGSDLDGDQVVLCNLSFVLYKDVDLHFNVRNDVANSVDLFLLPRRQLVQPLRSQSLSVGSGFGEEWAAAAGEGGGVL